MASDRSEAPAAWASWLNAILGVWLIISPWVVGYAGHSAALWNTLITGIVILLVALAASRTADSSPSWLNVALGVWLIVSPWVLGYSLLEAATANDVVLGVIVGMLALVASLAKAAPGRRAAV
jgi:SPW repeat-containing protein